VLLYHALLEKKMVILTGEQNTNPLQDIPKRRTRLSKTYKCSMGAVISNTKERMEKERD